MGDLVGKKKSYAYVNQSFNVDKPNLKNLMNT